MALVGKRELIASTGCRELSQAKIIASERLALWRRHLHDLDGVAMDLERIAVGHPVLGSSTFLTLREAADFSGFNEDDLLREAIAGRLGLFYRAAMLAGHVVHYEALERDHDGARIVPVSTHMPQSAEEAVQSTVLAIDRGSVPAVGHALRLNGHAVIVIFDMPGRPGFGFAPDEAIGLTCDSVAVSGAEIDGLRRSMAVTITAEQLDRARREGLTAVVGGPSSKAGKRLSEAIAAFMKERRPTRPDQTQRTLQTLNQFAQFTGDIPVGRITRDQLRIYRDEVLKKLPKNGHRKGADAVGWPSISPEQISRRMAIVAALFSWLHVEGWMPIDLGKNLASGGAARKTGSVAAHKLRRAFNNHELQTIFGASWFKTGRGELSAADSYREFMPSYFWLPLGGLLMGCRLNELCQLKLSDIQQTPGGTWFIDVVDDGEEGEEKRHSKTEAGRRQVPVHPLMIELGFISWSARLQAEGFDKLFPELRWDLLKGPGKDASKWFSRYLQRFGWPRDGTRVFHSLRHTSISKCMNDLGMPEIVEAELFGHARKGGTAEKVYRKNIGVDMLLPWLQKLKFELPVIAGFDHDEGIRALRDALKRKAGAKRAR